MTGTRALIDLSDPDPGLATCLHRDPFPTSYSRKDVVQSKAIVVVIMNPQSPHKQWEQ